MLHSTQSATLTATCTLSHPSTCDNAVNDIGIGIGMVEGLLTAEYAHLKLDQSTIKFGSTTEVLTNHLLDYFGISQCRGSPSINASKHTIS